MYNTNFFFSSADEKVRSCEFCVTSHGDRDRKRETRIGLKRETPRENDYKMYVRSDAEDIRESLIIFEGSNTCHPVISFSPAVKPLRNN